MCARYDEDENLLVFGQGLARSLLEHEYAYQNTSAQAVDSVHATPAKSSQPLEVVPAD